MNIRMVPSVPRKPRDLGERFAERPVEYDLEARVVDDSALIRAAVTNDEGSGSAEGGLGGLRTSRLRA